MRKWIVAVAAAALAGWGFALAADDEEAPPKEAPEKEEAKKEEPKEDVLGKLQKFGKRFRFHFWGTHTFATKTDKGDEKHANEQERGWWPGAWFDRKEDLKWEGESFSGSWDGGTDAWREVAKVTGKVSADGKKLLALKVEYRKEWLETKGVIKVAFELKELPLRYAGEETVRYYAEGADAKKALVKYEEFNDYGSASDEGLRTSTYDSTDWEKRASLDLNFGPDPD